MQDDEQGLDQIVKYTRVAIKAWRPGASHRDSMVSHVPGANDSVSKSFISTVFKTLLNSEANKTMPEGSPSPLVNITLI